MIVVHCIKNVTQNFFFLLEMFGNQKLEIVEEGIQSSLAGRLFFFAATVGAVRSLGGAACIAQFVKVAQALLQVRMVFFEQLATLGCQLRNQIRIQFEHHVSPAGVSGNITGQATICLPNL
jgi:hypothetical protein